MKILAGIPTRMRNTSGRIADVLAEVCDTVVVISQGATCNHTKPNVDVLEKDVNFGLVPARNAILDYALAGGYDVVLQSDDDLFYHPATVEVLIQELLDNPNVGTICSASRAYFNWSKEVGSNKNFVLSACAPQFWAARTEILRQVGYWTLPYLEDREFACRLWKLGYPTVQLHKTLDLAHNPFMSRTNDATKKGGQPEELEATDKHAGLKKAIDYMNEHHPDVVKMKYLGQHGRSFMTRYNWDAMIKCVLEKKHYLGYEDQKGRIL